MLDESQDEDLIGQMTGSEPEPAAVGQVEDMVSVLDEIASAHGKYCTFESFINQFGQVYCLKCGSNVGSVADRSDAFCPKCGCANSGHHQGKCLMLVDGKPCPCSDAHEFTESNWTRQSKEAKQWLRKREAARK